MHEQAFPIRYFFPVGLFQIVFPTTMRQDNAHTRFIQEEQMDLRCWTKIWATCVVEDASKSGHSDLELSVILERLLFSLGCKLILRRLRVLRNLVALQ